MINKKIITVEGVKSAINEYCVLTLRSIMPYNDAEISRLLSIIDQFHNPLQMKMPKLSEELIGFLELKLESEKSFFENYEVNASDDVFEDTEIKELYHKDMIIAKDLSKLIDYIKQNNE